MRACVRACVRARREGFASPLNASRAALARGGGFASANPDVDKVESDLKR